MIRASLESIQEISRMIHPKAKVTVIRTEDADNRILECALEAKAGTLVTGDMKHIRPLEEFQGIAILTPREFLDKYFPDF